MDMEFLSQSNIRSEVYEAYKPSEYSNMWFSAFFVLAVGDEAVKLVITKIPAILRKYIHVICILADDNEASATFERIRHCFRSVFVIGLGIGGCGKNAMLGYETIHPLSDKLAFKINSHLNSLKSEFGVLPSVFITLNFSGGTSSGYVLCVSERIKQLVRNIEPKAHIIDIVSISRGDYPPQIANSVLVTLKLLESSDTLVLTYFDREPTLRKLSDLNLIATIESLLLAKYRAGKEGIDITDLIGRGLFTTNTEYRNAKYLGISELDGENVFKLVKKAVDFGDSFHARAVFGARYADSVRISIISPVSVADLGLTDKKFESTKNVMAECFELPIPFIPISATAFLRGNGLTKGNFLQNHRKFAIQAIPELQSYLNTEIADNIDLESFLRGDGE